jgi:hypothetical protein
MSDAEQAAFAAYLRRHIPKPAGAQYHATYTFTEFSARVLGQPRLLHWRGLTRAEAQQVMAACRAQYPHTVPGQE